MGMENEGRVRLLWRATSLKNFKYMYCNSQLLVSYNSPIQSVLDSGHCEVIEYSASQDACN